MGSSLFPPLCAPCLRGSKPTPPSLPSALSALLSPLSALRSALSALRLAPCAFAFTALATAPLTPTVVSVTNHFDPPRFEIVADTTRVHLAGTRVQQRVGEPRLPFKTVRVPIPAGHDVAAVSVRPLTDAVTLPLTAPIDFGRTPVTRVRAPQIAAAQSADQPDPSIYGWDLPYPEESGELVSVQNAAGQRTALVRLFPLQYLPAQSTLVFQKELALDLTLRPAPANAEAALRPPAPTPAADVGTLDATRGPAPLSEGSTCDYLLITRTNLAAAFQPLLDLRSQQGLRVKVEFIEAITNTYAGVDIPQKLRNYLRYAYTNWGVAHVLLGGDTQVIPCRYAYAYVGSGYDGNVPSDLYYACLDGTWNRDGNNRWGEPTDGDDGGDVDLLAELWVGRAPVETVAEVNDFVEKLVRYETAGPTRPTAALWVSEFLGSYPAGPAQGGAMFDPMIPYFLGQEIQWLDDRPETTPQWTKAQAFDALNASPHFAVFNGHGTSDILIGDYSPIRTITTADLQLLTNAVPFLAYSVGCDVGQFDNNRFLPDCIGEEMIKRPGHGAFSAVFNSRFGWFDTREEWLYSGEFQKCFFDRLLTRGDTRLGAANQLGKEDLVGLVESTGLQTYRYCYYEITLLGDPATPLSVVPFPLELTSSLEGAGGASPAIVLSWPSLPDRSYTLSSSTNLGGSPFAILTQGLPSSPPENRYTNTLGSAPTAFYRVEAVSQP